MSKVSSPAPVSKEVAPKSAERRRLNPDRESDGIRIHISRRAYIVLYTIVLAPVLVGLGFFVGHHRQSVAAPSQPQTQLPT
ncbi:MAG: hypothetical protein ACXWKG_11650, partial [Limisphaerales bacterium]